MQKFIDIKGARENNLKNVSLKIPKDKLIVMTGLSGSGKTSLAFDTIYAEGQRRYVESLSAYARQFLGNVNKPDVDSIEGLSPAISIDQKTTNKNPRSTVGTVTEIYDYFRLLYARIGKSYCPEHGVLIESQTITQMTNKIMSYEEGSKVIIMSPVVVRSKGKHEKTFELLRKDGFARVRINGEIHDLDEDIDLDKNIKHTIEVIVDRIKIKEESRSRLYNSLETSVKLADGKVLVSINDNEMIFSEQLACPYCDFSIPKLEPSLFSFNAPFGACDECKGLGFLQQISLDLLVPDDTKTIRQGAIRYLKNIVDTENIEWQTFEILMKHYNISLDVPFKDLTDFEKDIILHGSKEPIKYSITSRGLNTFHKVQYIEGIADLIERRYKETTSSFSREYYNSFLADIECPKCHGKKLAEHSLSVKIGGLNIIELTELTVVEIYDFINKLELSETELQIAHLILKEIKARLQFLINVGLDYLTLSRAASTLSGGESQRIRLATQIGSHLTGVLYVLDEPSIGLHPRDNAKLIMTLKEMRDLGNTLVVVEHDEVIMQEADFLVDIGPKAGIHGGEVIASGTPEEVMQNENSITGQYLSKKKFIPVPSQRRGGNNSCLVIKNATENNLQGLNVEIPLGKFVLVTGVSGSGKSTLVNEILVKTLQKKLYKSKVIPGKCDGIEGMENVEKIIQIDQSPIGRTPRSNPATYTGVFDHIRDLFAETQEAQIRGYQKSRFSFNVRGGRCEKCWGDGVIRIEMHFLPDVYIECDECHGSRYNSETLEVKYKGKTIADVLNISSKTVRNHISNVIQKLGVKGRSQAILELIKMNFLKF